MRELLALCALALVGCDVAPPCEATPYNAATPAYCSCLALGGTLEPVNVDGVDGYQCTARPDGGAP